MTTYANQFSITCPALTNVTVVDGSFHITSGSFNYSVSHSGSTWTVTANCDRNGSATLAAEYVQNTTGQYNMFVQHNYSGNASRYDNIPTAMNFYFALDLDFSGQSGTVWLGQDGVSGTNYWWIGGTMILNSSPYASPLAYVVTPVGLYQASFVGSTVYQLTMSPAV